MKWTTEDRDLLYEFLFDSAAGKVRAEVESKDINQFQTAKLFIFVEWKKAYMKMIKDGKSLFVIMNHIESTLEKYFQKSIA